jgi:nucleoside-diphosphate-sugar epimerase
VEGDLHDTLALEEAMRGVTRVYHAAALVSFDPRDDKALRLTNVDGTANIVDAALNAGVQRLCHVSSTAAIGVEPPGVLRNEDSPWNETRDTSPYAMSKYSAELEVHRGIAEGLDAVIVNPCIILGPGAPGRSSMTLVERIRKGTRFHTSGSNAVVDARDVATCAVRLMDEGGTGERYLLVGENLGYRELFATLARSMGRSATDRLIAPWVLAMAWRVERLRTLFGGRPFITRHTAHSANLERAWSNAKVRNLLGHSFRPAREAAENVAGFLQGAAR